MRRAAKRQAAPRPLLKGPHGCADPFAPSPTVVPERPGGRLLVSVPQRDEGPPAWLARPRGTDLASIWQIRDAPPSRASETASGAPGRCRPSEACGNEGDPGCSGRGSGHARRLPAERPAAVAGHLPPLPASPSTGADRGGRRCALSPRLACGPLSPRRGGWQGLLLSSSALHVWFREKLARLPPPPKTTLRIGSLKHQMPARTWLGRGMRNTLARTHTHSHVLFSLGFITNE